MAVVYIARRPGLPLTSPPSQISGNLGVANIAPNANIDVWSLVNADIVPIAQPTGFDFFYSVRWAIRTFVTSSVPSTISAFFGNPERRYVGQLTFGTLTSNLENEQIHFLDQSFKCHQFLFTNTRNRILNIADIPFSPTSALQQVIPPDYYTGDTFNVPFAYNSFDYADIARAAFFPNISADCIIAYTATLLVADNGSISNVGVPL
jgi:hypothetical protein